MLSETEKEKILDRVAKKAGDYEESAISCSQGTLAALQEEFNMGGGSDVIKAAIFMPGIASRKETCGAVVGGLMALGLKFGRDKIRDPEPNTPEGREELFKLREKAWRFCEEFKKEFGAPCVVTSDRESWVEITTAWTPSRGNSSLMMMDQGNVVFPQKRRPGLLPRSF